MDSETTKAIDAIWKADMLGRKQEAQHLLRFLENKYQAETNTPFVLNIDSSWGHGKTFFIKHFATQLRHHNYPVVVFDAWKNDFSDEALLSFISAICTSLDTELNGERAKKEVKKLRSFATSLIKPALPILLSALVKQLTGMSVSQVVMQNEGEIESSQNSSAEDIEELGGKLSQLAASRALELYTEKKDATEGFIQTIENLVSIVKKGRSKKQLPIFIFVDELDRCRPTFSIELLEGIKHLFSTPGVYFIVSTDTRQLCHSIKAVYGVDFDAKRYLKRFFDIEYQLDTPNTQQLSSYLFEDFSAKDKLFIPEQIKNEHSVEVVFGNICDYFRLGARDIQQVFEILKTSTYLAKKHLHFIYLVLLACLQHKYSENPILINQVKDQQALNRFLNEASSRGEIGEVAHYQDFRNGEFIETSLKDVFGMYLNAISSNLLDPSFVQSLSNIGRGIALQIVHDNGVDPNRVRYRNNTSLRDKTLAEYHGLVTRAGHFRTELT